MLQRFHNMGQADRRTRIMLGALLVYVTVLHPTIIGDPTLNLVIGGFGLANLIAAIIRVCPAYTLARISTIKSRITDSAGDSAPKALDELFPKKERTRVKQNLTFAMALPVLVVLSLFSIVLVEVTHKLAMVTDSGRSDATALLASALHHTYQQNPAADHTESLDLFNDLAATSAIVVFHTREGKTLHSPYQKLGREPRLLGDMLTDVAAKIATGDDVARGMLSHHGTMALWCSMPTDEPDTWITTLTLAENHHSSITRHVTPRILVLALIGIWAGVWAARYILGKYTQRMAASAAALTHRTMHDPLTGLKNRSALDGVLEQRIRDTNGRNQALAIMLVDLTGFRYINDTLGYQLGDQLLLQTAAGLQKLAGEDHEILRVSSDVFCVICATDHDRTNACRLANRIHDSIENQTSVGEFPLRLQCRIGMAFYPFDSNSGPDLVRLADIALTQTKQSRQHTTCYQKDKDSHSVRKLSLLAGLRNAIEGNELELVYQPKVDIQQQTLVGVEALVRWNHPEYGFISPAEFVGWAEKSGLIDKLTHWVLRTAEKQAGEWTAAGYHIPIAINLSPTNLHDQSLPSLIEKMVSDGHFANGLLELELTENAVMEDPAQALDTMLALYNLGVPLAIDDFGTGLSSFTYLRQFPVSNLKIDRSFVMPDKSGTRDSVLLRSMIELGHNLGCVVTAEGVEDQVTLEALQHYECDYVQGYHICKPASAENLIRWYRDSHWAEGTAQKAA